MGTLLNRRRYMGGGSLPYDAEIEYLQSSGTQYINLPFGFDTTDEVEAMFVLDSTMGDDKYINSPNSWNTNNNRFGFGKMLGSFCCAFGNTSTGNTAFGGNYNHNDILLWKYKERKVMIPSIEAQRDFSAVIFGGTTENIRLFYGYNANTKGKMSYYKHIKANGIGVELISVRVGTIGYLYDKISGQLLGNAGTGEFILGPDKTT